MKKKRALLLFGSLAVLLLGYAAWCGRMFYLTVPVPELTEIPPDYREPARKTIRRHGLTSPEPFTWALLGEALLHPRANQPYMHVHPMTADPAHGVMVTRLRASKIPLPGECQLVFRAGLLGNLWETIIFDARSPGRPTAYEILRPS